MVALGAPPEDALAAAKWAYRLLMMQAYETMIDPNLSQSDRRREIRVILAGAKGHMTDSMRFDAKELIKRNAAELDARKRNRAAAKMQKMPSAPGAKVIPIRRG